MINLFCPQCKFGLVKEKVGFKCSNCLFVLQDVDGVLVDERYINEKDKSFYDDLYSTEHGQKWFQGLNRESFAKRILEKISLSYRRERFFRRNIKGKNNLILDLACGAGRDYFKEFGEVVGVDLSISPLQQARSRYDLVIQAGCDSLPFADSTFDYVISSDFFGHVRQEDKDQIMKEIWRVLKPEGRTLHVIETDSDNFWFKMAHKNTELFQKYFIEKIGGHVGLEMPSICIERWKRNNFDIVKVKKIWGIIWPIEYYKDLFDNEYKDISLGAKFISAVSNFLSRFKPVRFMINIILNPINSIVEFITPLNNGCGLMLAAKKRKRVLDYGCGFGGNYSYISKRGDYIGIDILENNINYAKNRYKGANFLLSDGLSILLANQSVEEIHAYDVLEHVENFLQVIREFDRILKKGGCIYITVPAPVSEKIFVKLKSNYNQEIGHLRIVDCDALSSQLSKDGYETLVKKKVRGMEAVVLSFVFWKRKEGIAVQFQTGSPQFNKALVAFIWLFDTRLFRTPLKYFFPIYILTLPIGWIISQLYPKSIYMVVKK